jgi:hypothetical protein
MGCDCDYGFGYDDGERCGVERTTVCLYHCFFCGSVSIANKVDENTK